MNSQTWIRMKLKAVEGNQKRRQSSFSLKRRRHSSTSNCQDCKRSPHLEACCLFSERQHISRFLSDINIRQIQHQKMKTNIIVCLIDWLWLFASLFGFNYHVPFRLSKIHFDCLVATEVEREVKRNILYMFLFGKNLPLTFVDQ